MIYKRRFKENIPKTQLLTKMDKWFKIYNKKLWSNELPKPIFLVKTLKNKVGLFDPNDFSLLLSNFYDLTEEQYLSVFIHEMIHLYQLHKYDFVDHGRVFIREVDRVNTILPFEVKTKESAYIINYGKSEGKLVGVMLEKDGSGAGVVTFRLDFFKSNYDKIKNVFKTHIGYQANVLVMGVSDHPKLQTYKTKRSLSRIDIHDLNMSYFDDIYNSIKDLEDLK